MSNRWNDQQRARIDRVAGLVPSNPWGLSRGECGALEAIVTHGCPSRAAAALDRNAKTLSSLVTRARDKMGVDTTIQTLLQWDREVCRLPELLEAEMQKKEKTK